MLSQGLSLLNLILHLFRSQVLNLFALWGQDELGIVKRREMFKEEGSLLLEWDIHRSVESYSSDYETEHSKADERG